VSNLNDFKKAAGEIMRVAKSFGLDFYDVQFELCPAHVLHSLNAYGMPVRFSHWIFGKAYYINKTRYDMNLSKTYEVVINSDPCYAFLLNGNSLFQNKLIAAHVYAHADFFKNNIYFSKASRRMIDTMAANAERMREYESRYGKERVEAFLDAAMSIREHVDPYRKKGEKCGEKAEKDLLLFIARNSAGLEDWQRDVLLILREEMLYFWPQMETKIVNEGWAAFWHTRIVRALSLSDAEALEFALLQSEILRPMETGINPYCLGKKIFESIEKRKDIFQVREAANDMSFLRNYLTEEIVEELDLYLYQKVGQEWKVVEKGWEKVKSALLAEITNCGFPVILVEDGNFNGRGELYLRHSFEGVELDVVHLEETLAHVYELWGRPVHLETVINGKKTIFSCERAHLSAKLGNT